MDIKSIIRVAFPVVVAEQCNGRIWISPVLNDLQLRGRISIQDLGICVKDPSGKQHPVEELITLVKWSTDDDVCPTCHHEKTRNEKIATVKTILVGALDNHDTQLIEYFGDHQIVCSRTYRYRLSDAPNDRREFTLCTAFARLLGT